MSHSANLIGLLEAVHHQDPQHIRKAMQVYLDGLKVSDPNTHQASQHALHAWAQSLGGGPAGTRPLGRYLYQGQEATVYDADGMEGLALHVGDGSMVFRVTTPPQGTGSQHSESHPYVDARWHHDDLGLRVIAGTYAALYHLADGTWTIDHSPLAIPAMATLIPE